MTFPFAYSFYNLIYTHPPLFYRSPPLPLRGSPLALSRFLRRAAAGACKNRSAAPASPRCFCRRQRSAQLPPFGGISAVTSPSFFRCTAAFTRKKQSEAQSPCQGAAAQPRGYIYRVVGCAAEPLPAAETGEAEQGQRSAFCKGAATPAAKTGHRNPEGLDHKSNHQDLKPGQGTATRWV